jgi:hypothetical protein
MSKNKIFGIVLLENVRALALAIFKDCPDFKLAF